MLNIKPIKLTGPWKIGYALDRHVVSSTFLGYDEYGHNRFDTKRSEVGELLYQLKYNRDRTSIDPLVVTVADFLEKQQWPLELIVPMPSSDSSREIQPVLEIAKKVGNEIKIPYSNAIVKIKQTPQLKDVHNYEERVKLLNGVFRASPRTLEGKIVLLFDDLYRSGATAVAATKIMLDQGSAKAIYFLTLTKTRNR